jgi:hypothetical protein
MSKINSIKITYNIIFSLGILAILSMGIFVFPFTANAQCYTGYWGGNDGRGNCGPLQNQTTYGGYYTNQPTTYYPPAPVVYTPPPVYNPPVVVQPTPTPTIYSSDTNQNGVALADPDATEGDETDTDGTDLSANASSASSGFLPSGVLQWIIFAILVMLIVILVRKIYGGREKFLATPLKHK